MNSEVAQISHTIGATRVALHKIWPIPSNDTQTLILGLCATFANADDVIDLVCSKYLGLVVKKNLANIAVNNAEFVVIVSYAANRGSNIALTSDWFNSRLTRIETSLLCTLSEPMALARWKHPGVKLAAVLAFQCKYPVLATLDALLGAVVRSDNRRIDDLHFESMEEQQDATALCQALELLTAAVL